MGKKCSRERSCGSPWEKNFVAGTKMWSYLPAGNSRLPSLIITVLAECLCVATGIYNTSILRKLIYKMCVILL
jgi:hypothetical protein